METSSLKVWHVAGVIIVLSALPGGIGHFWIYDPSTVLPEASEVASVEIGWDHKIGTSNEETWLAVFSCTSPADIQLLFDAHKQGPGRALKRPTRMIVVKKNGRMQTFDNVNENVWDAALAIRARSQR